MPNELGYSTIGGTQVGYSPGIPIYSKFTAGVSFTATKILLYTDYISGGADYGCTCGIYADSGGNIGARLSDTDEVVVPANAAAAWYEFTLDSPVSIVSGQDYWICQTHQSNTWNMYYDTGAFDSKYSIDSYVAGETPATPSSVGSLASDRRHSIYATDNGGGGFIDNTNAIIRQILAGGGRR